MRKLIRYLQFYIIRMLSYLFSYERMKKFQIRIDRLYTMWIANYFEKIGEGGVIMRGCNLQGTHFRSVSIGNYSIVKRHCTFGTWGQDGELSSSIKIGEYCSIGEYNHFSAVGHMKIGNGVLTGRYVMITDNNHGRLSQDGIIVPPAKRPLSYKGDVVIGNNVWICDKVTITSGVTIGDNVIIAANAVVTRDIPSNCMVAGVPAKIIESI